MTKLEKLKESNAWDERFGLPLIPMHNNPWIYLAYCHRCLGAEGERLRVPIADHFRKCETQAGYVQRWPGKSKPSHDELLGAAYLDSGFAGRALHFLTEHDGMLSDSLDPDQRDNIYRFVFMTPTLKAMAGYMLSLPSQVLFSLHVLDSVVRTKPGETSGLLMIWIMSPAMKKFLIPRLALSFWETYWTKKGFTPKSIFTNNYLTEVPVMKEIAPDTWE